MSKTNNEVLLDALVKFQRWCDAGGHNLVAENNFIRSQLAAERGLREAAEARAEGLRATFKVMCIGDFTGEKIKFGNFKFCSLTHAAVLSFPEMEDAQAFAQFVHTFGVALLAPAPEQEGAGDD